MLRDILVMIVRTVMMFTFVFVAMRVAGKRELGQISPFDFVVSVIIGELAAIPLENNRIPLINGVVPIATIVAAEMLVAFLSLKNRTVRELLSGVPSVIIENGRIREDNLRKARYNLHDLLANLRQQGFTSPAEVEFAILEDTGRLSVIPKSQHRPVTPADLGLPTAYEGLPLALIVDGRINHGALAAAHLDEAWLRDQLAQRGIADPSCVLLATLDTTGRLYVSPRGS